MSEALREAATGVIRTLQQEGYEAVFAGGCVRDRLLGRTPRDYDMATSATPDQMQALFPGSHLVGKAFGVIIVRKGEFQIEVATFREDGVYEDGRHPVAVRFADRETDAQRRDFTINAMFEDPIAGEVIDLVGGREDLKAGILRAVGDPARRFDEDKLRLLRAVRFAARFEFRIEEKTWEAMRAVAPLIKGVSAERIGDEVAGILTEGHARTGFELLDASGLLEQVLPEITCMHGCEQNPDHHPEGDVFEHTMRCIDQLEEGCTRELALGMLLHDVAKPTTAALREGRWTFYGHPREGSDMAAEICRRLRYSNDTTDRVCFLVEQHLRHSSAPDMKQSTLKRFLRQDGIEELLEIARMDAMGSRGDLTLYEFCRNALEELGEEEVRPDPLVTGRDLIRLGYKPGPLFREILTAIEDAQLEGALTTPEEALKMLEREWPQAGAEDSD